MAKEDKLAQGTAALGKEDKYNLENIQKGLSIQQKLRGYVDSIPTPSRDEGDPMGNYSLFALAKDTLSGALTLLEAPRTGIMYDQPEKVVQATMDMGVGMASAATKLAPAGAIGMFGSRPGVWASKEIHDRFDKRLLEAEKLDKEGGHIDEIHQQTGMSRDHEGNWRYEITDGEDTRVKWDKVSLLESYEAQLGTVHYTLKDVLDSPAVYNHWPELKDIQVKGYTGAGDNGEFAHFNVATQTINLNLDRLVDPMTDPDMLRRTLIHEAQHALQMVQGRPSGTNPDWVNDQMEKAITSVTKAYGKALVSGTLTNAQSAAIHRMEQIRRNWAQLKVYHGDMAAYYADPGEVEARLTEQSLSSFETTFAPQNRIGENIIAPDLQFRPEDLGFPSTPSDVIGDGKTFGTRPPTSQMAHPMDDPDFDKLPTQIKEIIKQEAPESLNQSGSKAQDFPDNENLPPEYYPVIVESLQRKMENYTKSALEVMKGNDPSDWEKAVRYRQVALEAEEQAKIYRSLIEKGPPK